MITMPNWGKLYSQLLSRVPLLVVVGALSLGGFLLYQHLVLWYQGSAYSSVYAQPHLPKVKRLPLEKNEQEALLKCVDVKAIVPKQGAPLSIRIQGKENLDLLPAPIQEVAGRVSDLDSLQLVPDFPLLLSRYIVKAPLLSDLVLESYLDKDGTNRILPASPDRQPKADFLEMGRRREFGLWMGLAYSSLSQVDETQNSNLAIDLSYNQDLFRVGPVWSGLRAEGGYTDTLGFHVKAQLGIPIVRF